MNYSEIKKHDIANGDGVRVTLFVSGCSLKCEGCFNAELWAKSYGKQFTEETIEEIIEASKPDYISGLSLLGGDPLEDYNRDEVARLCRIYKKTFPNKDIWLWTGRLYEDICTRYLVDVDVLIDGPFIAKKSDIGLVYRGSYNQRVLELEEGVAVGRRA